ncbi:MAG: hypothetical protein EOP86_02750, partial [Verrucomicrobiaceae bacterium]
MSTASLPFPVSDTAMDTAWLPGLLQLTDSFFPTGAYAHSFGLEGLVQEGTVTHAASLRGFLLEAFLPTLAATDLPIAALAWTALDRMGRRGEERETRLDAEEPKPKPEPDWNEVEEVCRRCAALKPSREPREASENIGRQRLEMLRLLHPGSLAEAFAKETQARQWPIGAPVAAALQ